MTVQRPILGSQIPTSLRRSEFPFSPSFLPGLVRVLDGLMIVAAALAAFALAPEVAPADLDKYIFCVIFNLFCYVFLSERAALHSINAIMRPIARADDVMIAIGTAMLLFLSVAFSLKVSEDYSRGWMLAFAGGSIAGVVGARLVFKQVVRGLSQRRLIGRSMAVLGVGEQSRRFLRRIDRAKPYFISVCGVFADQPEAISEVEGVPVLGDVEDLIARARAQKIDDIVVAMPWNADRHLAETVEALKELPVNVYLSTDLVGFELAFRPALGDVAELPMFEVVQRPISGWSAALKTLEDYVLATLIVVLISPLLILIAIAIKLDSPGPVLFRQKRLGFNNQTFDIYKFRSMHHRPAPEMEVRQATRNDPRVTRVGRIIRATSLDELPQLFNVLDGTMSLVGPRPHALSHNEEYGRRIRGYFSRHRVKPGITGWAQVNGFRGETERLEKMEARIRHDVYYAENWSILFDLRILVTTVLIVLFQKSAY